MRICYVHGEEVLALALAVSLAKQASFAGQEEGSHFLG
jgi:hypothetical protein